MFPRIYLLFFYVSAAIQPKMNKDRHFNGMGKDEWETRRWAFLGCFRAIR